MDSKIKKNSRLRFIINRLREKLWVKPLMLCLVSVLGAWVAGLSDGLDTSLQLPEVSTESVEKLLTIISASMLGIAVFAVGAMLSAYNSASSNATPRSFALVVSDDVSQNALSTFIGAFIFSIVALIALMNGFYGSNGRFVLFVLTLLVFAVVIINFVRWVDRVARLGRLGTTSDKVEKVTAETLARIKAHPTCGAERCDGSLTGISVTSPDVAYLQRIDLPQLQKVADSFELKISVRTLPGAFVCLSDELAVVAGDPSTQEEWMPEVQAAFKRGDERTFDEDPRFGLIVLSEIASRALSPGINDPGTAIDILSSFTRLFSVYGSQDLNDDGQDVKPDIDYDRIFIPEIKIQEMFGDAFRAIARDGAATIEVASKLQKVYLSLSHIQNSEMNAACHQFSREALSYAEKANLLPAEWDHLKMIASRLNGKPHS